MSSAYSKGSTFHSSRDEDSLRPANLFNVDGMIAVVTGGGTGIGLQIAIALESNGATVYITGRRMPVLEKAVREHSKYNRIIPISGDITKRESLLAMVEAVKARHGYIDLLVNNAGVARNLLPHPLPSPTSGPSCTPSSPLTPPASPTLSNPIPSIKAFQQVLWDTGSPDDFAETFATNVTGVYYTTVAFLDLLHQGNVRQQFLSSRPPSPDPTLPTLPPYHTAQVLTISSSGSFRVDAQMLSVSYTLAKCACTHLGKLLANLLAPWGIRSNVLAPGVWPSEMTINPDAECKFTPAALASAVPLRRTGSQEDMAGAILFLASRAGAYVNGAVWLLDGGRVGGVASSY